MDRLGKSNLAELLKERRKLHRYTQATVAERAGVSQQLIANIELGKITETRKLRQIARAFGLTVEQFLNRTGLGPSNEKASPVPPWPFPNISHERFDCLQPATKQRIEQVVLMFIQEAEAKGAKRTQRRL